MKLQINTKKLIDIIDISGRFVAKNATLPILQNMYLKGGLDTLLIRATDMEKFVEIELACQVEVEWAITVNAKMFSDILKTIEEPDLEMSVDSKTQILKIKTAKDSFEINGINANEYIALPENPEDHHITLNTNEICQGIEQVEYAVTEKNFSPVLTGVLLRNKKNGDSGQLIFVGTDSFRLAEYKTQNSNDEEEMSLIIPKLSINDIHKISQYAIESNIETMRVQYSNNLITCIYQIWSTKITATSLLIQGNFPDYDREDIMPKNFNHKVIVDKNLCEKAIKKIGILTRDINNFIHIESSQNKIIISSWKTDKWAWTTGIPAIIDGDDVSFGINWKYIADFIRTMKSEEICFEIVDNHKPIIISDKEQPQYKYVVRPLINN